MEKNEVVVFFLVVNKKISCDVLNVSSVLGIEQVILNNVKIILGCIYIHQTVLVMYILSTVKSLSLYIFYVFRIQLCYNW